MCIYVEKKQIINVYNCKTPVEIYFPNRSMTVYG